MSCPAAVHRAAANGVEYTGEGWRKTCIWTEDDADRFEQRPPKQQPDQNGQNT